ncbi:MAG TPA: N-acetylmuramoyl-L-alanine amidase [Longimicrobiales bacterium]|nr:N-acetylmuramoyl-L-alanine amidase [Longimicrobiales bacterium]
MRSGSAESVTGRLPWRFAASLALVAALLSAPGFMHAQRPVLRLGGEPPYAAEGVVLNGSAAFPASVLQRLGFRLAATPVAMTAVLGTDTLTFWMTSPFFRAGGRVHQLAAAVSPAGPDMYLPEQFFIQWLPSAYPDRFEFTGGEVVAKGPVPAGGTARPAARAAAGRPETDRTRVVVLDPGHGGPDPGKIGPNGLREKDVTLLISQRLAAVLRDRGYEVHLTRTTDTLIALADRPRLANEWRGDRPVAVFISIHANSAPSTAARGFETFFLSEARTEDERRVAEMENAAIRFEDEPVVPTGNGLDEILNNLRSDFLMRASHDLAAAMQEKMAAFHPGPNRGVKRAGFYVLVGAIMPAVLVETAFISNRGEADLLGTQAFQQKVAWGMADAVDAFFQSNEHLWTADP